MTLKYETDIVIIGAGPVGLFAIFECGMLKMDCHVVDTLDYIGGQCTALYPEKPIYDIPGFPSIDAADLIGKLEEQAAPFNPTYHLGQQVVSVQEQEDKSWVVTTSSGNEISCKAIIIAAGCGAFGPNRPPIENLLEFEESGAVAYMIQKKEIYRDKNVVIAGGGDSAVDWTLSLADIASKLYLVHRRAKFRAAPDSVDKLDQLVEAGKIELVVPYQLDRLTGQGGKLDSVIVKTLDRAEEKILSADHLLPFYGLSMELGPIATWDLDVSNKRIAVEHATCQTNRAGIYAIGDINNYAGKLKLIACGFSEAAMAAHAARAYINPDEVFHFEYSTSKGVA